MFFVSEIKTTAPEQFRTPLQENVYRTLDNLHIPFERVDTDEAITMDDCFQIDAKLQVKIVKTLFLCNRQHTAYYLFITLGSKPFSSKNFSASLGISRVSFAPSEKMQTMLGTKIGAATVFSALLDGENQVQIVFDRAVLDEKYYGCSDGTTTGYMKVSTEDILRKFLPSAHHVALIAEV
jgi:Ala-tRNA(Pro) deacylase